MLPRWMIRPLGPRYPPLMPRWTIRPLMGRRAYPPLLPRWMIRPVVLPLRRPVVLPLRRHSPLAADGPAVVDANDYLQHPWHRLSTVLRLRTVMLCLPPRGTPRPSLHPPFPSSCSQLTSRGRCSVCVLLVRCLAPCGYFAPEVCVSLRSLTYHHRAIVPRTAS